MRIFRSLKLLMGERLVRSPPQQGTVLMLKSSDCWTEKQHYFLHRGKLVVDTLGPTRRGRIGANKHPGGECGELLEEACRGKQWSTSARRNGSLLFGVGSLSTKLC